MISVILAIRYMKVLPFFFISAFLTPVKELRQVPTFGFEQLVYYPHTS